MAESVKAMAQNKQQKAETPAPPPLDGFALVELFHTRRIEWYDQAQQLVYYECDLCLGRSDVSGEIQHKDGCPVGRLK